MESEIPVKAVYYENGTTPKSSRVFPSADALEAFFDEQERVMSHAGFRVVREPGFMTFYPPRDSLSDGSYSTWSVVRP